MTAADHVLAHAGLTDVDAEIEMKCSTLVFFALCAPVAQAQEWIVTWDPAGAPPEQLKRYLTQIGQRELEARAAQLAQVRSIDDMRQRRKAVRDKILRLLGGLPDYRGPLNVKQAGTLHHDDYHIEKIIFESLPGFYVPANVYVPSERRAPFPAILMPVGHYDSGKGGDRETAVGLVKKGFLVLKYDALGQGERIQYYDPDLKASKVGGGSTEHSHANGQTLLIGDNIARYRIWDGMRGIDYLQTRKDVDPNRIGCTGCSGGGTLTTYISLLDDRVKAAAPSCYITSWHELLNGPGPQDAEQTFPGFLAEGLDFGDYIEASAPKPWLILSTTEDFFPLEGARQTYEEAKRIYALYGAEDRVAWFVGTGPHGVPKPSREAIYAWFIRWLKHGEGEPDEAALDLDPVENLLCTPTGQVSDSLGGETVFSLNRRRAAALAPKALPGVQLEDRVRRVAAIAVKPGGSSPLLRVHRSVSREAYRLDLISLETEGGILLPGLLAVPHGAVRKPAVLSADATTNQALAEEGGEVDELARKGYVVLVLKPRGVPEAPAARGRMSIIAGYDMASLAYTVGKTVVGMRAEDLIRGVDYLVSRPDVDRASIAAAGRGALGVAVLHAAVLDQRMGQIILRDSLALFRLAVERPVHRGLYEVALPGVLLDYDLDDLLLALAPRPVTIAGPVDALGIPLQLNEFRSLCPRASGVGVVRPGSLLGLLQQLNSR